MQTSYWHDKWAARQIAFHLTAPNPLLVDNFARLNLPEGSRVFVPLCGKTRDIAWLMAQGYRVCGAELVESAVQQLFEELGVVPAIAAVGSLRRYRAPAIAIFAGDLFALAAATLGPVDAVYDRAALVALPPPMRDRYTAHLRTLTDNAPQLLITYVYDQRAMPGPPFSVDRDEVRRHYADPYRVELMDSAEVDGGLKGVCAAREDVWALRARHHLPSAQPQKD